MAKRSKNWLVWKRDANGDAIFQGKFLIERIARETARQIKGHVTFGYAPPDGPPSH